MVTFIFFIFALLFPLSLSETIVVDGVSQWNKPIVQIGDSVIFQHKNHYNLYIFKNHGAFNSCNFTQATLLTKQNSTSYTWYPSRPGFFYFSFNNGTNMACVEGHKFAVKVSTTPPPETQPSQPPEQPHLPDAPPRSSGGGIVSSSPAYPWPFRPREGVGAPSLAPTSQMVPANSPMMGGEGGAFPFIDSNPAVPLPTGVVDSATFGPGPTSGVFQRQMVGYLALQGAFCCMVVLMLL
ncbi:hypothetical protein Leryth_022875 [Lithospermum erythrorhizon]|uniref:Uncharacterized protein n=1 Tax=Lithospermum erythrorhizon TaxID=34254 RepID=A0AAV3RPL1_LITER|nr:hypothetical protein Leryth_022875 [Lithospermum erythrorhizon]